MKTQLVVIYLVLALVSLGLVMVYSSSFIQGERVSSFGDGYFFFKKQITWVLISILAMIIASHIPYQFWGRINYIILGMIFLLLVAVFLPGIGRSYGGAHRWIKIGPIGFQPSEFAKLGMIIYLSSFIAHSPHKLASFKKGFIPIMLICSLAIGLLLLEPDIGTAVLLGIICFILLIVGGVRLIHMIPVLLIALPLIVSIIIYKFSHVQDRLAVFMRPNVDSQGKSYQITQALIGLGSGGWSGVGLGASKQKLFYLPHQQTDFIFAIIGEELGFIGTFLVIVLFVGLIWCGRRIMLESPDLFGTFLALGITLLIGLTALIHIGVVTALLPTKGIILPFISYGGSSLLSLLIGIGILLNIAKQVKKVAQ